jgi:hypothetical protein
VLIKSRHIFHGCSINIGISVYNGYTDQLLPVDHVKTDEDEDRLREVVKETEARCPVFNLIKDAGVELECVWVRSTQK